MRRSDRHVGEHSGAGHEVLVTYREGDLAFQNVKALFFSAVDVRGWSPTERHDGFPKGVLAVGVLAGRQEAVHIADDGNGPAFPLLLDDGFGHVVSLISSQ